MARPLTLYIRLKDDEKNAQKAQDVARQLEGGFTPFALAQLEDSVVVHYARWALVPPDPPQGRYDALMLITAYDGEWDAYARFFFESLRPAFTALAKIAADGPDTENLEFESFSAWVQEHDIARTESPDGVRQPFYQAYPDLKVQDIVDLRRNARIAAGISPANSLSDNVYIALRTPELCDARGRLSESAAIQLLGACVAHDVWKSDLDQVRALETNMQDELNREWMAKLGQWLGNVKKPSAGRRPGVANALPSIAWSERRLPQREIQDLTERVKRLQQRIHEGGNGRAFHQKAHYASRGIVEIHSDLPPHLEVGPFAEAGRYEARVRFSNARGESVPDRIPDLRGLAVRFYPRSRNEHVDLLTTNAPASFARNAPQFVTFAEALQDLREHEAQIGAPDPTQSDEAALAHFGRMLERLEGRLDPAEATRIVELLKFGAARRVPSLALENYWGSPVRLGDYVGRYIFWRDDDAKPGGLADPKHDDFLYRDLHERTASDLGCRFRIGLQLFVDEASTPIDDASVPWSRAVSPIEWIGYLQVDEDVSPTSTEIEGLDFNPGNGFEPVGITRARTRIYEGAARLRREAIEREEARRRNDEARGKPKNEKDSGRRKDKKR